MKTNPFKIAFAIAGVSFGITLFGFTFSKMSQAMGIPAISPLFPKMPPWLLPFVGSMHILVFLPTFIAGIACLKPLGAIGHSPKLIKKGIYKYLRNPMYSGISFTLTGLGLILDRTGIFFTGLMWLIICSFQSSREEKQLIDTFGDDYILYRKTTPKFIPDFQFLVSSFFKNIFNHPGKK